jgi:hypothetical protein
MKFYKFQQLGTIDQVMLKNIELFEKDIQPTFDRM